VSREVEDEFERVVGAAQPAAGEAGACPVAVREAVKRGGGGVWCGRERGLHVRVRRPPVSGFDCGSGSRWGALARTGVPEFGDGAARHREGTVGRRNARHDILSRIQPLGRKSRGGGRARAVKTKASVGR